MFTDPQTVTYATVEKTLPAISRGESQSVYRMSDATQSFELTLSHQFKARNRAVARLQYTATVVNPLIPAQNIPVSGTATMTIDYASVGATLVDAQLLGKALRDFLTDATILKLVGGET